MCASGTRIRLLPPELYGNKSVLFEATMFRILCCNSERQRTYAMPPASATYWGVPPPWAFPSLHTVPCHTLTTFLLIPCFTYPLLPAELLFNLQSPSPRPQHAPQARTPHP